MPGAALAAMSTSTQSWNDAASTMSVPKRSHAHLIAADAGFVSSSRATVASSARSMSTSGRSTVVGSRRLILIPPCCARAGPAAPLRCLRYPPSSLMWPRTPRRRRPRRTGRSRRSRRRTRGRRRERGSRRARQGCRRHPSRRRNARATSWNVLAGLALVVEPAHDPHDRFGRVLRRDLRGLLAEFHLRLAEVAAEQHLVARRGAPVRTTLEPEEPDVADVMLAAAVRAARDVDAHAADLGEAVLLERLADCRREAARLRDREVARVGAGAGRRRRARARRRARPCRLPSNRSYRPRRSASCRSRSAKF